MIKRIIAIPAMTAFFSVIAAQSLFAQTTLEEIINDMILPHEGLPHGVPLSYDWSQHPRKGAPEPGEGWTAAIAWGQVYEWAGGSKDTNARIQVKDLEMYYLSKSDHQWHLLQKALRVSGANYVEDFAGDVNKPADIRLESDGSISTTCGDGYNFHFWPSAGRSTIPVNDVAGCFTTVKARIIPDDPDGVDDMDSARYLMSVGGDWWLSLTAPWDNWKTNWDIGIGRFRFITPEWKSFNMYSVPADTLRNNPPPFLHRINTSDLPAINPEGEHPTLLILPNPVKDKMEISYRLSESGPASMILYDSSGRVVDTMVKTFYSMGDYSIQWSTASCKPGFYYLVFSSKNERLTRKIVIAD